eukprot:5325472-Amphidinium_carterae.1
MQLLGVSMRKKLQRRCSMNDAHARACIDTLRCTHTHTHTLNLNHKIQYFILEANDRMSPDLMTFFTIA